MPSAAAVHYSGSTITIVFVLDCTVTRQFNGVLVDYSVKAYRSNTNYTGAPTAGSFTLHIYEDNSDILNGGAGENYNITIPNNGTIVKFKTGQHLKSISNINQSGSFQFSFSTDSSINNLKCVKTGVTINYSSYTNITDPGAPTINITDNNNNTFKIIATAGSPGTNNPVVGLTGTQLKRLYGYIDGEGVYYPSSDDESYHDCDINTDYDIYKSCRVNARTKTKGTYSNSAYSETSKDILYHTEPGQPSNLTITTNKDNKYLTTATYNFNWSAGLDGENNPIINYEYEIYKNNVLVLSDTVDSSTFSVSKMPIDFGGLLKDDVIYFKVRSKSANEYFTYSDYSISNSISVVSSGLINVRINNTWVSGQLYIRDNNDDWFEASAVYVRDNNDVWQQSS